MFKLSIKWTAELVDLEELAAALAEDVAAAAIETAGKKLKWLMQAYTPVETGKLRRSIDYTVGIVPIKHLAYAVIGPRSGSAGNKYAHLVEFGHIAVAPRKGTSLRHHSARAINFVPPRPFIRPAVEGYAAYAGTELASGVENNLAVKINAMSKGKKITVAV
jgi:HK97 gp10 family phage protein